MLPGRRRQCRQVRRDASRAAEWAAPQLAQAIGRGDGFTSDRQLSSQPLGGWHILPPRVCIPGRGVPHMGMPLDVELLGPAIHFPLSWGGPRPRLRFPRPSPDAGRHTIDVRTRTASLRPVFKPRQGPSRLSDDQRRGSCQEVSLNCCRNLSHTCLPRGSPLLSAWQLDGALRPSAEDRAQDRHRALARRPSPMPIGHGMDGYR
jgi:hypothetical protein